MLAQFVYKYRAYKLRSSCRSILTTPPIVTTDAPLVFVSQLRHKDLYPYLVAIKSVHRSFNAGGVIVVDDGSLTDADHAVLRSQVEGIDIRPINEVQLDGLQAGGTWERLVTLVRESARRYAIQVDADIVANGKLTEIVDCWKKGVSFALANKGGPGRLRLIETGDYLRNIKADSNPHVVIRSEMAFENFKDADKRFYRRTTSAFTGLAIGSASMEDLIAFSAEADEALGEKWKEWGSEQVASNYIVANSPENIEIAPPHYMNNTPKADLVGAKLVHFFGTHRYYRNRYLNYAKKAIAQMR